jgi:uncharacterized protein (DUF427 family)
MGRTIPAHWRQPDSGGGPTVTQLVQSAAPEAHVAFEESPRWIRAMLGGETIADSKRAMLVTATGRGIPAYYFPIDDVRTDLLVEDDEPAREGAEASWTIRVGERSTGPAAAWSHGEREGLDLRGYVTFDWNSMDAWYEEGEEVFVHARDPYKRIDVLESSRHVEIVVGGETVADTRHPRLLFETGLPTRYYIPKLDVRMGLLTPTSTSTSCPYKGDASYWSVEAGGRTYDDIVWSYRFPLPEVAKIANLLCFFQEKVSAVVVDGEEAPRPLTASS